MASLLHSGNFVGYIGLTLLVWVGIRLVRSGHRGGWLLSSGAILVAFSMIYPAYIAAMLVNPIHLTFSREVITLLTMTPTMSLTLGFVFLTLGLFMVAARQQKEQLKPTPVHSR
ncbi:MAG: hypothetical protein ACSHYB_18720 [Roseibacillus sp.]